ncbi:radical SAM domain protein [Oceaniovalibus guishaninsula JLT2003]|uniref:Radical SAM domain protein n=1 Tax=Oceaniovalibus guishaninsula JLT2003 TaxID=1231392 RepID=K2H8Y3_9RHOB|nr:PA0069 family radical SAM protein [Oceaniovalibus guishaninsula]EKE44038.1 radical SAM domain protein [Oceaniovalibus guishaninsula JLT2003]
METDETGRIAQARRRGRGAASNPATRFDPYLRAAEDDGWTPDDDLPPWRTEVSEERSGRAMARNTSPDIGFDRSLNPYRGCEHGCIYCFARPTHAYLNLSPGLDFETRLVARPHAPAALERELRAPSYRAAPVALGTATDPYQPIERDRRITRRLLEVLQAFRHPVTVATRGTLVERDADILGEMGQAGLARVGITITTLDPDLARRMEPRAPSPARRLRSVAALAQAGIPVRVMVAPIVPGLTDAEIESILTAARDAGAEGASWVMLRLPYEVSALFQDWLADHVPLKRDKVLARLREMHDGQLYAADWGRRMRGQGPHADLIGRRFALACARLGLTERMTPLRRDLFAPPPRPGDQLSLF